MPENHQLFRGPSEEDRAWMKAEKMLGRSPREILRRVIEGDVREETIEILHRWELDLVARLLAVPCGGKRGEVATRTLNAWTLRNAIAAFPSTREGAEAFADTCRKERLKWLCKQQCLWQSGNKVQLAIVLLNWRDRCRQKGNLVRRTEVAALFGHQPELDLR